MLAWLAKTPRDFNAASYSSGLLVSLSNKGIRGMNTFMTIGSTPICLLKLAFPMRAMFLTKSASINGTFKSLFIRFFKI